MDKLVKYRKIIVEVLQKEAETISVNVPEVSKKLVSGSQGDFLVVEKGWHQKRYLHNIIFHIEIKGDKVWIHQDNTDSPVALELESAGIPRSDMILGFVPTYARELQGFSKAA